MCDLCNVKLNIGGLINILIPWNLMCLFGSFKTLLVKVQGKYQWLRIKIHTFLDHIILPVHFSYG